MGLQTTRTALNFQSPGSPYTEIVTGGLAPYTASSGNVAVVTVAQGTSPNLATSSDTLSGWTINTAGALGTGGPNGATDYEVTGTGTAAQGSIDYSPISVTAGTVYIFSAWCDPSQITAGQCVIGIYTTGGAALQYILLSSGSPGRFATGAWTCPAGTTQIQVLMGVGNCTIASGQKLKFSQPMLTLSTYDPNVYISQTSAWLVTPKYRGSATITYTDSTP